MWSALVVFAGVSALVICTPGPDTLLTIRNTLTGGRGRGVRTAAGVASGQFVWTIATSVGLAGLIAASRPAFDVLRYVGAAYLVFLGVQSLWAAVRGVSHDREHPPVREGRGRRAYAQGLINDLANPKMAAFFLSLLPQFAPNHDVVGYLAYGSLFCVMTLAWLCGCAIVSARARNVFERARPRRLLDAVSGFTLVGLGARIAAE